MGDADKKMFHLACSNCGWTYHGPSDLLFCIMCGLMLIDTREVNDWQIEDATEGRR